MLIAIISYTKDKSKRQTPCQLHCFIQCQLLLQSFTGQITLFAAGCVPTVWPILDLFSALFASEVKWIKSRIISFPGVAASFASVAYRIAISNFWSASLGAVRLYFFFEGMGWWSGQKIYCSLLALSHMVLIGPLHDWVTWYGINYTGMQVTPWDFQNKGSCTSPAWLSLVLKVPLHNVRHSVIYSVPCDWIVQRAY